MTRVCFERQLDPLLLDEYIAFHHEVWPKMLRAIARSGRHNYSLFLRSDGLLIGYYEVDDDNAASARLASDPDTAEWEAASSRFFLGLYETRPDQAAPTLREVFNLEEQLARLQA